MTKSLLVFRNWSDYILDGKSLRIQIFLKEYRCLHNINHDQRATYSSLKDNIKKFPKSCVKMKK